MGLLDVLNGMANGPRGQSTPASGMSPLTMGLLALLAYKALKGSGGLGNLLGQGNSPSTAGSSYPSPGTPQSGGGLSGWLQSALGGAAAGGAPGSILSGGL